MSRHPSFLDALPYLALLNQSFSQSVSNSFQLEHIEGLETSLCISQHLGGGSNHTTFVHFYRYIGVGPRTYLAVL